VKLGSRLHPFKLKGEIIGGGRRGESPPNLVPKRVVGGARAARDLIVENTALYYIFISNVYNPSRMEKGEGEGGFWREVEGGMLKGN